MSVYAISPGPASELVLITPAMLGVSLSAHAEYQMEGLSRGIVAVRASSSQIYVGCRLFGNDPSDIGFNLYCSINGGAPTLLNGTPLTGSTNNISNTIRFESNGQDLGNLDQMF